MKLSEIASVIAPDIQSVSEMPIAHLLTDSRQPIAAPAETLFFALRTAKDDGVHYIADLYAKGVRAFVVDKRHTAWCAQMRSGEMPEAIFLLTENPLTALQDLAAYKRSLYPQAKVIGITGSNGKTVVKEWIYELLKDDYCITRSPKSYNSQIGVPLSVWQMNEQTELAIFEAGISEKGEMERLERIIRPTIGVLTYIGEEHGENFASTEEKRAEKLKLFSRCETVIEDPSHQNLRTCAAVLRYLGYTEERIATLLMEKTHETVMQVNLSALAHNVRCYRSLLKPETRMVCMVKAFAYGAGPVEISRCLQDYGLADYLAVAVADEAAELRHAGINLPLIVMDPEPSALSTILENNAEPNIHSFSVLEEFSQAVEKAGLEHYPIHIKIDSGMNRLGFSEEDIPTLAHLLQRHRSVRVRSVFSHLAAADEPQWDRFTHEQIERFNRCADLLCHSLTDTYGEGRILRHILNSAGIERFSAYQLDMCRLGIGMYGFPVAPSSQGETSSALPSLLRNVCTLKTTLLSIRTVHKGESIGYGRHTFLQEDRQIAVIPIGYADGFDRRLGNYGGEVIVRGQRCPVVGNVCMDLAMIDVTGTDARPGDEAIIFGDKLPVSELAEKLGTISYEILTSVSRRVKRTYYYE